jgi:pimeloyl-ACP methyl ester carboxylesterase
VEDPLPKLGWGTHPACLTIKIVLQMALCFASTSAWTQEPRVAEQFRLARENHVTVIDARGAVDVNGRATHASPMWITNVQPGTIVSSPPHDLGVDLRRPPSVIIIFVHGYNTSASEALADSNVLWRYIQDSNDSRRTTDKALPRTNSMAFYAFLWKGDYGKLNFSTAVRAADNTASVFSEFLEGIMDSVKDAKIVIVTHSLGTEVVLAALKNTPRPHGTPFVSSLVIIQGAVPFYSIYHWKVRITFLNPSDGKDRPDIVEQCSGGYADAINSVSQVIYTLSANDHTLGHSYSLYREVLDTSTDPCDLPIVHGQNDRIVALGSPADTGDRRELVQPPQSPQPPSPVASRPPVHQILPRPYSLLINYTNMKIQHPNVSTVPIANYPDTDSPSYFSGGHSVVFETNGRKIVQDLWSRVAVEIETSGQN